MSVRCTFLDYVCFKVVGLFINMVFLGPAFMIMIVYIWSRRNPYIRMNFFGLINFYAPYLPWVLLAFSFLLGNSITVDIMGEVIDINFIPILCSFC